MLAWGEIMSLLGLLQDTLKSGTDWNFALSPIVQLLTALCFYATGRVLKIISDAHSLSKNVIWTVSKSVHALTRYNYIQFPAGGMPCMMIKLLFMQFQTYLAF